MRSGAAFVCVSLITCLRIGVAILSRRDGSMPSPTSVFGVSTLLGLSADFSPGRSSSDQ